MESVEALVVGAGVVGLATARALARAGHEVVILEALAQHGSVTSARNSEVLHAGLYYPSGSLKARLCREGHQRLQDFCDEAGVPYRLCGKLVVATKADEVPALQRLHAQALTNGASEVEMISGAQARHMEPALSDEVHTALWSPRTGIIDSHALMLALLGQAQTHGAQLALMSPALSAKPHAAHPQGGWLVQVGGDVPLELHARYLVNAAGLRAHEFAGSIEGLAPHCIPPHGLCKGNYFSLAGRNPFKRLIYPMPSSAGLGTHLTLDLAGAARFGPDVQWLPQGTDPLVLDYTVDPERARLMESDIRRYWPDLPPDALQPAYSGVRPKICGPGEPSADFCISGPSEHGLPGLVNLFGIESPGLTASLCLADEVLNLLTGPH